MRTTLVAFLAMALATTLAPSGARAQQIADGTITVVQPKPVLRNHRVSFTPRIGMTINDPVIRQWSIGGNLHYNITERGFIGPSFDWFDFGTELGGTTSRYEEVITATNAAPELSPLNMYAGLEGGYVPLYGKAVLFNKVIIFLDLYTLGGVGVVDSSRGLHVGGTVAAGVNLYFNRWLGLNTEFRDRITTEEMPSGNEFTNTVTGTVGLTIMLPFNFDYRFDGGS